jgi:hypothetical protein
MDISMKKIISCLFSSLIFTFAANANHGFSESLFTEKGIDAQIEQEQEALEGRYYQLLENGYFPASYNNNLIIDTSLTYNVTKEGQVLLTLIQWLEKQDDRDSVYLLKKINKLFFLRFHQLMYGMKLSKEERAWSLQRFQDLYRFKAPMGNVVKTPFRTMMTKVLLLIYITNASEMGYEKKQETMAYVLDKVKKEMILVNRQLDNSYKLSEDSIKDFVTMLEVYAVKEPIVKTNSLKKFIVITVVVIVIGYLIYKYVVPNKQAIINKIRDLVGVTRTQVIKPIIKEVVVTATETACEVIEPKIDAAMKNVNDQVNKIEKKLETLVNGQTGVNGQAGAPGAAQKMGKDAVIGVKDGVVEIIKSPFIAIGNLFRGKGKQQAEAKKDNTK